jgi:NAD(P)H-dependent flavin oxidoreductase YrpB (nitropropane dioxygenase family)
LDHDERNTFVMGRSLGLPGRVLSGDLVSKILDLELGGCSLEEMLPWISGAKNRLGALEGDLDNGYVWAGQGIGLINDIPSVSDLVKRIMREADTQLRTLRTIMSPVSENGVGRVFDVAHEHVAGCVSYHQFRL